MNKEKTVIGIRADGNAQIGMGHLMRCISMAKALEKEAVSVVFFTATDESGEVISQNHLECQILDGDEYRMEKEVPVLLQMIKDFEVDLLLVDSYQVTEAYMHALDLVCPVFYMDDTGEKIFPVSGIINYNIYGQDMPYMEKCRPDVKLLLGSGYAPVKAEFTETAYEVRRDVQKILLTMGGSDSLNIAGELGKKLLQRTREQISLELICGKFNPHRQELERMAQENPRLHVLTDVQDMWNKMADADIAVSAAGSTMYELSALGVPTVCCYYVENQRRIAEGFAEHTKVVNAGNYAEDSEKTLERIAQEIESLIGNYEKRAVLSASMKEVADGQGARRLAQQLKCYAERDNKTKTE